MPESKRCPGPEKFNRRQVLRVGSFGIGGLGLPALLAGRSASALPTPTETAAILLFLHGGPSQLETFDLKPDAPSGMRSMFRPIASKVPGIEICEHLPLLAAVADKFSLIRSLNHEMSAHSDGQIEVMTGKTPARPDPTSTSVGDHPDVGHIASERRGPHPEGIPRYVAMPSPLYATSPRYLGEDHKAFAISDPSASLYMPIKVVVDGEARTLDDRRRLLGHLDELRRGFDLEARWSVVNRFQEQAFTMLTSSAVARAFDLSREDPRLRDRYGRHRWGQSCLMARRLAEAGTAVVTLYIDTPLDGPEFTNWDDHAENAMRPGHFAGYMQRRLPYLDQAVSALIEDLYQRGTDRQIMVVVVGEFGRTPKINKGARNSYGRDHWPAAYSALVAGGGLSVGTVVGATDRQGAYPSDRPLSPKDLLATVYRHLGINTATILRDHLNRPFPILAQGEPIRELLSHSPT